MPSTSFVIVTASKACDCFDYLRDYSNVQYWDHITRSVEKVDDDLWRATFFKWNSTMNFTREETVDEGDEAPMKVTFRGTNERGNVRTVETYEIRDTGSGSVVVYSMRIGLSGWRRLLCFSTAVWVQLIAESSRSFQALKKQLDELSVETV